MNNTQQKTEETQQQVVLPGDPNEGPFTLHAHTSLGTTPLEGVPTLADIRSAVDGALILTAIDSVGTISSRKKA